MIRRLLLIIALTLLSAPAGARASDPCATLHDGPTRGVMCLHCMYPPARAGVGRLTDAVIRSCQKHAGISFVTDGTWGYSPEMIRQQVRKLALGGRVPHLHLYLINGPAQRRWNKKLFTSWSIEEPRTFGQRLVTEGSRERKRYVASIQRLLPILQEAAGSGAVIRISPALEDNFTNTEFAVAASLIEKTVPAELGVTIVRSPCGDCYRGNGSAVPAGVVREVHQKDGSITIQNGVVANDGMYFLFSNGTSSAWMDKPDRTRTLSHADIRAQMRQASALGDEYYLWIGKYQGSKGFLDYTPLDRRHFDIPTSREISEIASILAE